MTNCLPKYAGKPAQQACRGKKDRAQLGTDVKKDAPVRIASTVRIPEKVPYFLV